MSYSQKYCLVSFINPIETGTVFDMVDWPLHVTLADVFAIDLRSTNIEAKLEKLLSFQHSVKTVAGNEATLGTTEVILLHKTKELAILHASLIDLLEENSAQFNTPEFTRGGFVPHCTIQKVERLLMGDEVIIRNIALVDMFPNENWQQRKIINIFRLQD